MTLKKNWFVQDIGSGLPVVLIHGYPLNHRSWEGQFTLSDAYRIIMPDLPGFGKSEAIRSLTMEDYADLIASMLDDKKLDKAVVMGHSMGGYIALAFAERHRNRLSALGLICSQAGADSEEGKAGRLKNAERVEREGFDFVVETMLEKLLSPASVKNKPELLTKLRALMNEASSQGILTALKAMTARRDHFDTLRSLTVPVFIAAGKSDVLIPMEKSMQMAEAAKHASWESFAECGHMVMMEDAASLNQAIRNFLTKL